ncbi:MBL fold metallo-hydrolase [Planococcus shenhongbingii]|uniref:MBL fold metallo-hydrolase n=1 Tax=Planococcus shenhongbingii TaxID=3058398 RepID=A0ABT8NDA9_9BACL|nr:MBL fold metallo-hydrolase [Planococcus sp. N017]MDN7245662.1 MBL fold metallo-hydrolase [Planococcus sp. N017]
METYFEKVTDHVYCFLVWDDSWKSYNNFYVVAEATEVILIDSGKAEHFEAFETALAHINFTPEDISTVVATHGHKDHIEGTRFLPHAEALIHAKEVDLLPIDLKGKFSPVLPDEGSTVMNLESVLLGHHTPGSVALYHEKSKVLFCGDHLCFFGDPLPDGKVVAEGEAMKEQVKKFVTEWSENEEMRIQHNFELFIAGLKTLQKFDAKYLCTGHGVIIKEDMKKFFKKILDSLEN